MTAGAPPAAPAPPGPPTGRGFEEMVRLPASELAAALATDPVRGLAATEVADRLDRYGPNDPAPASRPRWPAVLGRQFTSKLILLLVAATAISAVLGEWLNSGAIGITVVISAGFGFLNEFRSERAIAALRGLTAQRAEVVRDGLHEEVLATGLVPGDLIAVSEGRSVPADARVVEARGLLLNESILTGEPEAVPKSATIEPNGDAATPATALYAGTTVAVGSGLALVVSTGARTVLGGIFTAMQTARRRATPLEERLEQLGNRLVIIFLALCVLVIIIGIVQGRDVRLMFEMAVSLAIGAVPEGLPAVATTTLAVAVRRLAARQVLVRRLDAVETLGSTTVIATDKTGTLTENRMVVRRVLLADGPEFRVHPRYPGTGDISLVIDRLDGTPIAPADTDAAVRLLVVAALCNDAVVERDDEQGWHAHGDPSEAAIALAAAGFGHDTCALQAAYPRVATEPFTSATRVMRTTHRAPGGTAITAVKGAFESVSALAGGDSQALAAAVHALADQGFRVFTVAEGIAGEQPRMLGAIVLEDPLRADAADAVLACRAAGIRLILITGDQINTARNVGRETGILHGGLVAVRGSELDLDNLDNVAVVARASHAQKEAIVDALQSRGEVVAMTGDGVNDAPALRSADVGVAIGQGATDVAVEAAHIVVADGRLFSLVHGIREGRQIARNLRQAIIYLLTASFGTIVLITLAMAASDTLPLAPLQILWLNLVVHIFPALALSTGREPVDPADGPTGAIISNRTWLEIGWRALTVGAAGLAALLISDAWDESAGHGQAMVFATLATGLVGQGFLAGVHSPRAQLARLRRPGLWLASAISAGLMLMAMYLPGFRDAIDLESISAFDWAVVGACAAGAWIAAQAAVLLPALRPRGRPPAPALASG